MMKYPLTINTILNRARTYFPRKEVVTRLPAGTHRYTYSDLHARVCKLGKRPFRVGRRHGRPGVGVFGWNTYRYLEAYFAAPCMGAVVHTINIRLAPNDLVHIINHAKDKILLIDEDLLPAIEAIAPRLGDSGAVRRHDRQRCSWSPACPTPHNYEVPHGAGQQQLQLSQPLDEDTPAGLCYTSATTGNPKGVVYSATAAFTSTPSPSA